MKLGLIGLKGHQTRVLNGAQELGGFEVVGIADDDQDKIAATKRRYRSLMGNAPVFEDWRRLLDHSVMDVCCVCDENGVRFEQLAALTQLGVHIVTEKPLTTTLDDLEKLRQMRQGATGRLTMLLTMRHEAAYAHARRLVQEGVIGEPSLVTSQKSYRLETRPDWFRSFERLGGTIPYIGIHAVDLMSWVTGLDYTHVAAFQGKHGKREIMGDAESHASLLLRMSNGASATARLDYLRPQTAPTHGDDRLRIAGTEGVLEVGPDKKIQLVTSQQAPHEIEPEPTSNLFVDFVEAIRADRPSQIPEEDCFAVTHVVLTARQAANDGMLLALEA